MITHPAAVAAILLAIEFSIIFLARSKRFAPCFEFLPPVFWIYFLPMVASTFGLIDPKAPGKFLKSNQAYSTLVAGIYSTKPGFVGRLTPADAKTSASEVPMAMVGRVPTKVSAENGPIHAGDLLVASSKLGYAMKGTDRDKMLGAVVGKALGSLDSGAGVIEVLVTLQ